MNNEQSWKNRNQWKIFFFEILSQRFIFSNKMSLQLHFFDFRHLQEIIGKNRKLKNQWHDFTEIKFPFKKSNLSFFSLVFWRGILNFRNLYLFCCCAVCSLNTFHSKLKAFWKKWTKNVYLSKLFQFLSKMKKIPLCEMKSLNAWHTLLVKTSINSILKVSLAEFGNWRKNILQDLMLFPKTGIFDKVALKNLIKVRILSTWWRNLSLRSLNFFSVNFKGC